MFRPSRFSIQSYVYAPPRGDGPNAVRIGEEFVARKLRVRLVVGRAPVEDALAESRHLDLLRCEQRRRRMRPPHRGRP
jgi:hypothetical protein